jgi:hypothetical protein
LTQINKFKLNDSSRSLVNTLHDQFVAEVKSLDTPHHFYHIFLPQTKNYPTALVKIKLFTGIKSTL